MSSDNFVDATDMALLIDTTLGTTITQNNVFRLPTSELVVAALIENGMFSGRFAAPSTTAPVDTTLIWPDKNSNPTEHKYWTGAAWVQADFANIWGSSAQDNLSATTSPGVSDDDTAGYSIGSTWVNTTSDLAFIMLDATTGAAVWTDITAAGDVVGPASSVDNTLPRFDSTTGKLIQTSGIVVDDSDNMSGVVTITLVGTRHIRASVTNGFCVYSGGSAGALGGNLLVYGESHAGFPGDFYLRSSGVAKISYSGTTGKLSLNDVPVDDVNIISDINAQTGTTYTFVLTDSGQMVTASNAAAQTYTVPPNSSVAFQIGCSIDVIGLGAGVVTFAQGAGVTIRSLGGNLDLAGQYAGATLRKIATNEWVLVGSLV